MRLLFPFLAVFVLLSVLTAEGAIFSADSDLFLGQKRRRGSEGRVWTNLYYGDTTLKPTDAADMNPQFYGFQLGCDLAQSHGVYSTFFFNLNQSNMKWEGNNSIIDNYLFGYGKFFYLSMCHFTFTGSLGYDRYNVSSETGAGLQTNFFGEFGLDFLLGKWGIKPFYALQYDFLYHGDIGNSPIRDWNGHGLNQLFGLRLNWKVTDMLELQSRAVWVHEMLDNPPPFYHARFSPVHGTTTPAILYYQGNTGRDWAWLGIGGKLEGVYNVYLFFDYDVMLNERHLTHLGSIGLCLGW